MLRDLRLMPASPRTWNVAVNHVSRSTVMPSKAAAILANFWSYSPRRDASGIQPQFVRPSQPLCADARCGRRLDPRARVPRVVEMVEGHHGFSGGAVILSVSDPQAHW